MSANKVYIKYQIQGVSSSITESFAVTRQNDAKELVESKYNGKKVMFLNVVGPTMTPPAWFHD